MAKARVEIAIKIREEGKATKPIYWASQIDTGPDATQIITDAIHYLAIRWEAWIANHPSLMPSVPIGHIQQCPLCGAKMKQRTGKFGVFWGCPKWKETGCQGTLHEDGSMTRKTRLLLASQTEKSGGPLDVVQPEKQQQELSPEEQIMDGLLDKLNS
jgi:hypothetical protein